MKNQILEEIDNNGSQPASLSGLEKLSFIIVY